MKAAAILLAAMGLVGCSESSQAAEAPAGDAPGCTEDAFAPPELQLDDDRPALERPGANAYFSGDVVRVGERRVAFDPARAGDALSAALVEALPKRAGSGVVNLWAPADLSGRHVLHVARAFGRAGLSVRLVARRDGAAHELARIDPPRPDTLPPEGTVPEEIGVWVDMSAEELVVATSDGGWIDVGLDPAARSPRWDQLGERLAEQRQQDPDRRRLAFVVLDGVPYSAWAHALEIAAQTGFDAIELTPLGVLEALREEVGWEQLRRGGGVHSLPDLERAPAVMPAEYADRSSAAGRSTGGSGTDVEIVWVEAGGYLDEAVVERVAREHLTDLAFCYDAAPGGPPDRERQAILAFAVDESGRVRSVAVVPPVGARGEAWIRDRDVMGTCLRAQVAGWAFAPSSTGHLAGARLALRFATDGGAHPSGRTQTP